MGLHEIWEIARFEKGDETQGIVISDGEFLADYEIKEGILIVDIPYKYLDSNVDDMTFEEIEDILRDNLEDIDLNTDIEMKFNTLRPNNSP